MQEVTRKKAIGIGLRAHALVVRAVALLTLAAH